MVVGGPPTGTFGTPVTGGLPGLVVDVVAWGGVVVLTVVVTVVVGAAVVEVVGAGGRVVVVVVGNSVIGGDVDAGAAVEDAQAPELLGRATITAATLTATAARRAERENNINLLAFDAAG